MIAFLSYAEAKDVYPLYKKEYENEVEENRIAQLEEVNRKIHEMLGKKELDFKLIYEFIICATKLKLINENPESFKEKFL